MSQRLLDRVDKLMKEGFSNKEAKIAVSLFSRSNIEVARNFLHSLSDADRKVMNARNPTDIQSFWDNLPENEIFFKYQKKSERTKKQCEHLPWSCLHCFRVNYTKQGFRCEKCHRPGRHHPKRMKAEYIQCLLLAHVAEMTASIIIEYMYEALIIEELLPFYQHQWLDVCDTDGKWLPAQVIETDGKWRCLVHYRGWIRKYDEWIIASYIDKPRVDFYQSYSGIQTRAISQGYGKQCHSSELFINKKIMILDAHDNWIQGKILDMKCPRKTWLVLVTYDGYSNIYNEWIPVGSSLLREVQITARKSNTRLGT